MRCPLLVLCSTLLFAGSTPIRGQSPQVNANPDLARIVTTDIPRFWQVFREARLTNAADLFQHGYLDSGSVGLRDFIPQRIVSGRNLAATVAARPHFYAAIQQNTLALSSSMDLDHRIHESFRKLKQLYPAAVFPDVYFVIGRLNSGGTVSSHGLIIGTEMNARDPSTPLDELSDYERSVTGIVSDLPYIVAHEVIHTQQPPEPAHPTLLGSALREGSADFLGELISGENTNRPQHTYGNMHERELWLEFSAAMHGTDISRWLYQGNRSTDRPADLGYYMGYQIARAYYLQSADKRRAIAEIITSTDADALLEASRYGEQFRTNR